MTYENILAFPKVDLHCHLDGSMSVETVREIGSHDNINIPTTIEGINSLMTVNENCQSLMEYLKCFDLPISCIQSEYGLETAAYNLIKRVYEENVIYIEVRFAPLFSVSDRLSSRVVVESVLSGLKRGFTDFGVYSTLILCAMRHQPVEMSMELVDIALEYKDKGVGAVDLAGDEVSFPPLGFKDFFDYALEKGVNFTIHAGENGPVTNVTDALSLGTKRLGHGIAIMNSPEHIKLCRDNNITLEMCPISNLHTKAAKSWQDYPFKKFLLEGLKVTINTDNRTVSGTSSTKEFVALKDNLGLTKEEVKVVTLNALDAAFLCDDIRNRLREKVEVF